jgi:ionotropic glutamate receptor
MKSVINLNDEGKINVLIQIKGVLCESNRLSLRLVVGVWCLAAFVFVQAYMSTLITYVVTPINFPLINSAYDIPGEKEVNVLIRKSGLVDYYFSASSLFLGSKSNGILIRFAEKQDSNRTATGH